jgi:hypothetical protein
VVIRINEAKDSPKIKNSENNYMENLIIYVNADENK